jgi:superfamily II DNA or RNA helicase
VKLRKFQNDASDSVFAEFEKANSTLVVLPTGCGKTLICADVSRRMYEKTGGRRVMVIAHREELIFQAKEKIMTFGGLEAQVEMGEYRVEKGLFGYPPVIVSTVQTHTAGGDGCGRMGKFDPMEFGLLIIDECFPAGTPVDGKPIETICKGDMVNAFDHEASAIVLSRVKRTFKSRPSALCRVVFADGTCAVCTPGHPFYNVTTAEYVPASMLTGSDYVFTTKKEKQNELQKNMQGLRNTFHSILQPVDVLDGVHEDNKDTYATTPCDYELPHLRKGSPLRGEERTEHDPKGACLLLKRVHEDILLDNQFLHHGTDQQDVCLKADDRAESDAQGSGPGEGLQHLEKNGLEADRQVRQRDDHGTAVAAGLRTRLGDGDTHKDGDGAQQRISDVLQGGHREHGTKDRRGGGRQHPSCHIPQAGRREEGCHARVIRVERVEILERGSDGGFGEVCPDGYVYNIEVEKHHNYFADGILVHNCHHSVSASYKRVIEWYMRNPNMKLLGVTATPDRTDEEALGQVFGSVAFDYEVMDAIKDGWLVPVSQQMVTVGHLDLSEVRTTAGDLNAGDLSAIMDDEQTLHEIASPTIEICGSRRTLVFAATVKQAERLCEIFNRHRKGCASFVCGKTDKEERKLLLAEFKAGKTQFVVNVGVLTEGFDDDGVEVVVMARPTKSRALYAQMAGRGTRPHSSIAHALGDMESAADRVAAIKASPKPGCLIVDFVGNCGRHKLCTTADILGGNYSEEEVEKASQKAKNSSVPVDMTEALDEARRDIEEAKRREADKRAAIVCRATFSVTSVDPFDVFQIHKTPERGWDKHKKLSEAQLALLAKQGISTDGLSYSESKQLLDEVFRRFKNNECSYKQVKTLKKFGYSGPIKRDQAKALIDRIAANGWRAVK